VKERKVKMSEELKKKEIDLKEIKEENESIGKKLNEKE
jgi:hypothetical protein